MMLDIKKKNEKKELGGALTRLDPTTFGSLVRSSNQSAIGSELSALRISIYSFDFFCDRRLFDYKSLFSFLHYCDNPHKFMTFSVGQPLSLSDTVIVLVEVM